MPIWRRREASPEPGAPRAAEGNPASPYMRNRKPERPANGVLPHRELFGKGARLLHGRVVLAIGRMWLGLSMLWTCCHASKAFGFARFQSSGLAGGAPLKFRHFTACGVEVTWAGRCRG